MAKDMYSHMTVGELKAFVKKYKKVHCKPFSKLDRAGLIELVKEIEAHERKVEVVPKMSAEEIEKHLEAKKETKKPRVKKEKNVVVSQNALAGSATPVKVEEKKEVVEKKKRVVSDEKKAELKNVFALKKARGISLKEAWALHKAGEKSKKKFVLKKKEEIPKKEEVKYVEPNWFKSVNDPEYFKVMSSKQRKDTYNYIFGFGEEKFSSKMLPHLKKGYIAWCKKNNKECHLTKKEEQKN